MKIFTILLLVILGESLYSQNQIKVEKTVNGIELTSSSCDALDKNVQAIIKWTRKVKEQPGQLPVCACDPLNTFNLCRVNISDIVPNNVKEMHGKCSVTSGPNCFNSALVDQKILSHHRVSRPQEIKFWLDSDLCREKEITEVAEPGDLMVVKLSTGDMAHAFTYISEDISFSKDGPAQADKYQLEPLDNVLKGYKVSKDCSRVKGDPDPQKCGRYINYYSCLSLDDYMKGNKIKDKEILKVWRQVEKTECHLNQELFNNLSGLNVIKELVKQTISLNRITVLDHKDDPKLSSEQRFFWNAIWFKLLSLEEQLKSI